MSTKSGTLTKKGFFRNEILDLKIANVTPHPIDIYDKKGEKKSYPPFINGGLRLITPKQNVLFTIDGIEVIESPQFKDSTVNQKQISLIDESDVNAIIVSMPLGIYLKENPHILPYIIVIGPETGNSAIRSEKGEFKGSTQFVFYRYGSQFNK